MHSRPKTVRFAQENTVVFYPTYLPPAPALSSSSGTPPSQTYALPTLRASKNHHADNTHQSHRTTRTPHRYLLPSAIAWDIRDRPSNITRYHHHLSTHALSEPATSPPSDFMRIVAPGLPWSIKVYPATHGAYVTLRDVLDALYDTLRTNVRSSEFAQMPSSRDQAAASAAYQERYRRLRAAPKYYDEEKRAGMKRVDFLLGRTRFVELAPDSHHHDQWCLIVS